MSSLAERVLADDEVFMSSMESIEVVTELERRRMLVDEGKSGLLAEGGELRAYPTGRI